MRLIDADELIEYLRGYSGDINYVVTRNAINTMPTVERPKGEWVFKNNITAIVTGHYECSRCGVGKVLIRDNYCPACGAEMRG